MSETTSAVLLSLYFGLVFLTITWLCFCSRGNGNLACFRKLKAEGETSSVQEAPHLPAMRNVLMQ